LAELKFVVQQLVLIIAGEGHGWLTAERQNCRWWWQGWKGNGDGGGVIKFLSDKQTEKSKRKRE
jgi:hypothetical protein